MWEHTKKHHIEEHTAVLLFHGRNGIERLAYDGKDPHAIEQAVSYLEKLGFSQLSDDDDEEALDWREAFDVDEEDEPGICLSGARHKEGLTQRQLAEKTGIPQRHISEMENSKRPIGKVNAKKFAAALNVNYKVFL